MELCIQSAGVADILGFEEGYAIIKETGFTAIDWGLDEAWNNSDLSNGTYKGKTVLEQPLDKIIEYYADELAAIRKNGLKITQAHAPFPPYWPGHPEIMEYAIDIYKKTIEFCDYAGCENLVIHGVSLKAFDKVNTPESIDRLNMYLYESLIPTLLKCNVTVCLENMFVKNGNGIGEGTCAEAWQAVKYIDSLNEKAGREVFGFCLDTGHMNLLKKEFRSYVSALGKRIKVLHIHDNDGVKDSHLAPLTGNIRWDEFCQALNTIGYDGDLSFETYKQAMFALDLDKELLKPWLDLIYETGKVFRKKIQEKA